VIHAGLLVFKDSEFYEVGTNEMHTEF